MEGLRSRLETVGKAAGLDRIGFTGTEPFTEVAQTMRLRIGNGMAANLGFTYDDPEVSTTPLLSFPWGRTLVVGARAYLPEAGSPNAEQSDAEQRQDEPQGRVSRVAVGDRYAPLRFALDGIADQLRREGYRAEVLCDDNRLVDRAAAVRAGVGWWGKNTMVLVPGIGPWAVIGSVITDAELLADAPLTRDCGSCSACIPACPTGALVAPGVLDAERCLAAWAQRPGLMPEEYRVAMGDRIYGCDSCVEACPPGGKLLRQAAEPAGRFGLEVILRSSDQSLLAQFGNWFIPNRDPKVVRRNALIAAGNSGSQALVPSVAMYVAHPDWVLRAHAAWALQRLGGRAAQAVLVDRRSAEADPRVRSELV